MLYDACLQLECKLQILFQQALHGPRFTLQKHVIYLGGDCLWCRLWVTWPGLHDIVFFVPALVTPQQGGLVGKSCHVQGKSLLHAKMPPFATVTYA